MGLAPYTLLNKVRNHNEVWDAVALDWVAMTQPLIKTDTLSVNADITDDATRDLGKVDVASLDQYTPISGRLPVDGSGVTQPVSAATLPLPSGAAKEDRQESLIERTAHAALKKISIDSAGRLRVSAEAVASHAVTLSSLATLTNITNWGLSTATAKSQWESHMQYETGFRRNLVHS